MNIDMMVSSVVVLLFYAINFPTSGLIYDDDGEYRQFYLSPHSLIVQIYPSLLNANRIAVLTFAAIPCKPLV